jgi:prepilin-type N-terminal cleavage/methylation domain-containing protein
VSQRPGFTLMELMLVLALMVVLAAISYPSIDALYGTFRVTAAGDAVRAAWAQARAHAVNEGCAYRFGIVSGGASYRVAPETTDYWPDATSVSTPVDPSVHPFVLTENLPRGVRFNFSKSSQDAGPEPGGGGTGSDQPPPSDPGSYTKVVTFQPDGTASDDVEIVFQSSGARPLTIKLRGLTGTVATRAADSGSN